LFPEPSSHVFAAAAFYGEKNMFQLTAQSVPEMPGSITLRAIRTMRGSQIKAHKTLKHEYLPGEKLHLCQTTDGRGLIILERDKKFIDIQEKKGTLKDVLPRYEKKWESYLESLLSKSH